MLGVIGSKFFSSDQRSLIKFKLLKESEKATLFDPSCLNSKFFPRSLSTFVVAPLTPDAIKNELGKGTIKVPDTEEAIIAKINDLKAKQDIIYRNVTGRNRRHSHVDALTPCHIPSFLKIEANIVRLRDALPGTIKTIVVVNRGLSNRFLIQAAHERGLKVIVFATPEEGMTEVNDKADEIIIRAGFDYMNGPENLELIAKHVDVYDPHNGAFTGVFPGIAFLSEQGQFSGQVEAAGYRYLGGSEEAVNAVGDKSNAKALAEQALERMTPEEKEIFSDQSSPVIRSISTEGVDPEEWPALIEDALQEYSEILMKNAFGGGGQGIEKLSLGMTRDEVLRVLKKQELVGKLFNNITNYLLEKFISPDSKPRHIEVQIVENKVSLNIDGEILILDIRDCSDQKNLAKMLEKSAINLDDRTIQKIQIFCNRFVEVITSQHGAICIGTIEFLADKFGHIYFMEMNTRLQVENIVSALRKLFGAGFRA